MALRAARLEIARLVMSSRWFACLAASAATVYLAAGEVDNMRFDFDVSATAWDVHAVAVNNIFYLTLLLVPAFLFVIGDTVSADAENRYTSVVITRAQSRHAWLAGKLMTVVFAALIFQVILLSSALAMGWVQGKPLSTAASPVARYEVNSVADVSRGPLFAPAPEGQNMAVRQVGVAAYLWLTFSAIGAAFVALSIGRRGGNVVIIVWFGVSIADRIVNWLVRSEQYAIVSPTLRLVESAHTDLAGSIHPRLTTSVALGVAVLAAAVVYGRRRVLRAEL